MKLELKHLSPYLPYDLPFRYDLTEGNNRYSGTVIMNGISNHSKDHLFIDYSGGLMHINHCKLILRPLSDLTKEIEVNSEKFVPIEKIRQILIDIDNTDYGFDYIGFNKYTHRFSFDGNEMGIKALSYHIVLKFYEWHFDVNSLIKNGLAIDINKL